MADAALVAEVAELIRSVAKVPAEVAVGESTRLVDELGVDSLDLVGVVLQIQDQYGVAIGDDDVAALRTVGDLVAQVAARARSRAVA